MGFLSDVGNSSLSKDVGNVLNTALTLKKMETDAAYKRDEMDIRRQDLAIRRSENESQAALRSEQIEALKRSNEEQRKKVDRLNTPIRPSDHPLVQNNFGPDGAKVFEDQMIKFYGKNGTITREQFLMGMQEIHDVGEKWQKFVIEPIEKNWKRRMEVDSLNAEKAKTKFDSDPSKENYAKLQEAQGKLAETKKGEEQFGVFKTKVDIQRDMANSLEEVKKSDPGLYKEYIQSPDLKMAIENADSKSFGTIIENIRKERKALEVARINAAAKVEAKGAGGMTENQKALRTEKEKKELLDAYKADTTNVIRKYRLTAEQREFIERGENPANVKGIAKETAEKINKDLSDAKLRYDDRYGKKFGERPLGSKRFTPAQQSSYSEYKATRDKILNAKKKKDGSAVTAAERNAALTSLDEEARNDGLVE